jgi:hypothetical protein
MSLTSTARVKAALGIPSGITFNDTAIGYAVDDANDFVLRAIGYTSLTTQVYVDRPIVVGIQDSVVLRRHPALSLVGVTNNNGALTTSDYRLDLETSTVRLETVDQYWSMLPGEIAIEYVAGWTENTVPKELTRCATMIAAGWFNAGSKAGMKSETFDGARYDVDPLPIPAGAQAILSRYEDAIYNRSR